MIVVDTLAARVDTRAPTLSVRGLSIGVERRNSGLTLVSDVELEVHAGETLGLVGESGSGKSLTALACLGLLPAPVSVTSGSIMLGGEDVTAASDERWRELRGARIAMIFQDPMTSLDPCFRIGHQIVEAIRAHEDVSRRVAVRRAFELLGDVGIDDPARRFEAFPHELSGGLRQRVMIAAALALAPDVLVADEPTTALDVTTQAGIIELVRGFCADRAMSMLWISHDLAVVAGLADRVAVMYAGEIIEVGCTHQVFSEPDHPYTNGLIDSAVLLGRGEPFGYIAGAVPEPAAWPPGCRFAPRCGRCDAVCSSRPALVRLGDDRLVRCHHPIGSDAR